MADTTSGTPSSTGGGTPATPPAASPTVTFYDTIAAQVQAVLDTIPGQIPGFSIYHVDNAGYVKGHQAVSLKFISTVVAGVNASPDLQSLDRIDVSQAKDTLQFINAFSPIVDRLNTLTRNLKYTMDARKADAAAQALEVYNLAKGLGRSIAGADIAALAGNMKRDLNRKGGSKKDDPQPPAASQTTTPPATSAQHVS